MADKKTSKKKATPKKEATSNSFAITKSNGKVIYRNEMDDTKKKRLEGKGWKVEAV